MSICIQLGAENASNIPRISLREVELRAEFNTLPSWRERAHAIDEKLRATERALSARNEKLLTLRGDFDALTLDFWRAFTRSLGCENPAGTIAQERARQKSWSYRGAILLVITLTLLAVAWCHANGSAAFATGALVTGILIVSWIIGRSVNRIAGAQRVSEILRHEQEHFWLTGGNGIALSNLGITPPPGADWYEKSIRRIKFENDLSGYVFNIKNGWHGDGSRPVEPTESVCIKPSTNYVPYPITRNDTDFIEAFIRNRVTFVFVRYHSARFTIDGRTSQLIWKDDSAIAGNRTGGLTGEAAAGILQHLMVTDYRYRSLVNSFSSLVWQESDLALLYYLRIEAREAMAEELRAAELRAAELRAAQEKATPKVEVQNSSLKPSHSVSGNGDASWDTLVISSSLRENLQAYCRILRDYKAYQKVGVKLPKGLLFYGPPGCGKTQIAKTLATEAGLNFVALSTSECKAMWIGQSAAQLAAVFREAREKQPSLIFIDELDVVCSSRGLYLDCISQEFTGELLQQLDGIGSDADAIFLCGATNRHDQIDAAILSRFAEQIEIPLPDETARRALLEVFLGPLRFSGNRKRIVATLAAQSEGKSGRDLRALVNQAVLAAVKRTSSPQEFGLSEQDFVLCG